MDAESLELEDGEVVDDEPIDAFGSYNVLKRPHTVVQPVRAEKTNYSDESDDTSESASDTDSDSPAKKIKRPKIKARRRKLGSGDVKKTDKYKIWCTQVQEEVLTEDLVSSCGVTRKKYQGRSVENYDLPEHLRLNGYNLSNNSSEDEKEPAVRTTNKRTHADRKNVRLRLGKRQNSMEVDNQKGSGRTIAELSTNSQSTDEEVACDIAEKLNENKESLIQRVVDIIGKEKAIEFYEKTKEIEEDGGMLIMNGSRRRTPGGVYLYLIKNDEHIPQEKIREIFVVDKKECTDKKRADERDRIRQKAQELMRNGSEKDLPALLTRSELSTRQIAEEARLRRGEGMERNPVDSDRTVSNPPPSPATDDPDHHTDNIVVHHQRQIESYNDDFLDLGADIDTMEMF